MTDFVHTADASVPFDYRLLPDNVTVILGYIGLTGETPHVWTDAEIDAAHKAGYLWAPIVTVAQRALTVTDGKNAAAAMRGWCNTHGYPIAAPVFMDVENSAYTADPHGAMQAVTGFQDVLAVDGRHLGIPYLPWGAQRGWGANWTNVEPTTLPRHLLGWQWSGPDLHTEFDLSIFLPGVFAGLTAPEGTAAVSLTKADQTWIVAQLDKIQSNVLGRLNGISADTETGHRHPNALVHLAATLAKIDAEIIANDAITGDVSKLATDLAAALGPKLAAELATELSRRLAA